MTAIAISIASIVVMLSLWGVQSALNRIARAIEKGTRP